MRPQPLVHARKLWRSRAGGHVFFARLPHELSATRTIALLPENLPQTKVSIGACVIAAALGGKRRDLFESTARLGESSGAVGALGDDRQEHASRQILIPLLAVEDSEPAACCGDSGRAVVSLEA